MFHKDGRWKEFGTSSDMHTVFPFWLACIVWAIVSYLITLLIVGEYRDNLVSAAALTTIPLTSAPPKSPEDLVNPLPIKTKGRQKNIINTSLVGYHMLNKDATEESGIPQYIYVGDKPLKKPGYYMVNNPKNTVDANVKPQYTYVGNDISSSDEEGS